MREFTSEKLVIPYTYFPYLFYIWLMSYVFLMHIQAAKNDNLFGPVELLTIIDTEYAMPY